MGRHQGMDRPGVRQVPEGSGGQGKMEEMVVKSSVVPQRPQQLRIDNDDELRLHSSAFTN